VSGSLPSLVAAARQAAGDRDVYLDGGALVRSALEAGLVDELTCTVVPVALGRGRPLLAGLAGRLELAHASLPLRVGLRKAPLPLLHFRC
jgi:dihydrofolate reductase